MEDREPGFCEANGYERPVSESNMVLEMGLAFEDAVCELAEKSQQWIDGSNVNGKTIEDREKFYSHKNLEYVTCHIDGQYSRLNYSVKNIDDLKSELHEGKTTSIFYYRENFGEPGTDRVPQEYQIQCQHQMLCTGIDECILSVLVFPFRQDTIDEIPSDPLKWAATLAEMGYFHQYFLKADPDLQSLMLSKYRKFWERHVLTGKPPRPRTYRDIRRLVKAPQGTIVANAQIERWAQEYKDIGEEMKWAKNRKDELKTKILEFMRTRADVPIDDESQERWILKSRAGRKLNSYNGKTFR
jgi:hypothetical protein